MDFPSFCNRKAEALATGFRSGSTYLANQIDDPPYALILIT